MSSLARTLNQQFLSLSEEALAAGSLQASHNLAQEALLRALQEGDSHYEARAHLLLARLDVVCSRMHRAKAQSAVAAQQFARHEDGLSQSVALSVNSYACAALGLEDQSQASAKLAFDLQESLCLSQGPSMALNYLGVASFWSATYEDSDALLEASVSLAQGSSTPDAGFQPLLNRCFNEMLVLHDSIANQGIVEPDPTRLVKLLQQTLNAAKSAQPHHADVPTASIAFTLMHFVSAMAMTHCHDLKAAYEHLSACKERLQAFPADSWLHALVPWSEVELYRLKEDRCKALRAAQRMRVAAYRGEHVPVQSLAQSLEASLLL